MKRRMGQMEAGKDVREANMLQIPAAKIKAGSWM
jgi:hypothetical protein